jgi:hypothetical protein
MRLGMDRPAALKGGRSFKLSLIYLVTLGYEG